MNATKDKAKFDGIVAFRDAAIADGWHAEATYQTESFDRAAHLTRDGYTIQIITRDNEGKSYKYRYNCSVNIWGPDGLSITAPAEYDFDKIEVGAKTCLLCGKVADEVFRYNFAGKACADCIEKAREETEKPGWNA